LQTLEPVRLADGAKLWTPRVFHNTYTYKGRRRTLRGWSVKLQHQGRRKTFSLAARTRDLAVAEAAKIHHLLRKEGWDAVLQLSEQGRTFFKRTDVRYWKGRLHFRKYGPGCEAAHCSALVEHEGHGYYFLLDRQASDQAAAKALSIYKYLLKDGWDAVRGRFTYEATMAFRWSADPLLWSYTTLHTINESPVSNPSHTRATAPIAVIESRPEIARAIVRLISRNLRKECAAFQDPESWLATKHRNTLLCVANVEFADRLFPPGLGQLTRLANGTYALPYSIHVDSDELFLAAPGGKSGYCYKRLTPEEIIHPILGSLECLSSEQSTTNAVQVFFNSVAHVQPNRPVTASRPTAFTRRENEVLALLSKGFVDKEIARALGISAWTVHEHVKRVFEKLHVHSRIEATLAYLQK
jgi:DNA-binding NarL/FixJ family response regulator